MAYGDRVTGREFNLLSANKNSQGISVDATYAYVADTGEEKVYVYQLSDGAQQTSLEFDLHADNTGVSGFAVDATYAYVVDITDTKVYVYQLSDGARQTSLEFDLHADNGDPRGLDVDATYAYVADAADTKVYVYQLSDGARQTSLEFDLHADHGNPRGIGVNTTHAYVDSSSSGDSSVYVYQLSDGARQTSLEFDKGANVGAIYGLAVDATYAYLVGNQSGSVLDKVYVYDITPPAVAPGAPSTPTITAGISQLTATWNAPSSPGTATITAYDVRHRVGSGSWTVVDNAWTSGDLTYTITGLTAGSSYEVQVRGVSSAGDGSWSNSGTGTPTSVTVPGAPTLGTLTQTANSVTVPWTAPSSNGGATISAYDVRHRKGTGAWTTVDDAWTSGTLSYTITGLDPGTSYGVQVRAVNSAGDGTWSSESTTTTSATTPGAPTVASVTAVSSSKLTVTWTAPTSNGGATISAYDLRHRIGSGSWTTIDDATSGALTYSITGLKSGTEYEVQVRAVNSAGDGTWSSGESGSTSDAAPDAPSISTATASGTTITVTWTAPSHNGGQTISSYDVRHRIGSGAWTTIDPAWETGGGTLTYDITGLAKGSTYEVQVRAVNSVGNGTWSSGSSVLVATTVPDAPTITSLTVTSSTQIVVIWSAPVNNGGAAISAYDVQHRIGSGSWTTVDPATSGALTYTITGLTAGTTYEVQVRAVNSIGDSSWSGSESGTTNSSAPGAPTSPAATASGTTITVTWTAPTSNGGDTITAYDVRHRIGSGNWTLVQPAWSSGTLTYDITGLAKGSAYEVQVRAVNSTGSSAWSSSATATISTTVPGIPTLTAVNPGDASITIQWTLPTDNGGADLTSIGIRHRIGSATWTEISGTIAPSLLTYTITGLTNDSAYEVQIRVTNSVGNSSWTSGQTATPASDAVAPTVVVQPAAVTNVTVEPSPTIVEVAPQPPDVVINIPAAATTTTPAATPTTIEVTPQPPDVIINLPAATPAATPAPVVTAPSKIAIMSVAAGHHQLTINYPAPATEGSSSVEYYDVRLRNGPEWTVIDQASTDLSHTIRGLANDVEYDIQVRAVNSEAAARWSDIYRATPMATRVDRVGFVRIVEWDDKMWGITSSGQLYYALDFAGGWEVDAKVHEHHTPVTDMLVYQDGSGNPVIYVLTETGMWVHDFEHERFVQTTVTWPRSARNGKGSVVWRDTLYIPVGMSVYRYTAGANAVISLVGPDRDQGVPWSGDAQIIKLVPTHNSLIAVVQSTESTSQSYLLTYNVNGWHVLWDPGTTRKITRDALATTIYGDYSVWIASDDLRVIDLPVDVINPATTHPKRRFAASGYAITPWFDGRDTDVEKLAVGLNIDASGISETETITIEYATNNSDDWIELITLNLEGFNNSLIKLPNPDLVDQDLFPLEGIPFRNIRFRISMATGDAQKSPDLHALVLEYDKRLARKWGYQVSLDLTSSHNGLTPKDMIDALEMSNSSVDGDKLLKFQYRSAESEKNLTKYVRIDRLQVAELETGAEERANALLFLIEP